MYATEWELVPAGDANEVGTYFRNIGSWGDDRLDVGPLNLAEVSDIHLVGDTLAGIPQLHARVVFVDGRERFLYQDAVIDLRHELARRVAETRRERECRCMRMWSPSAEAGYCAEQIVPLVSGRWQVSVAIHHPEDPGYDLERDAMWLTVLVTGFLVRYNDELVGFRHDTSLVRVSSSDDNPPRRTYLCLRDDSILDRIVSRPRYGQLM